MSDALPPHLRKLHLQRRARFVQPSLVLGAIGSVGVASAVVRDSWLFDITSNITLFVAVVVLCTNLGLLYGVAIHQFASAARERNLPHHAVRIVQGAHMTFFTFTVVWIAIRLLMDRASLTLWRMDGDTAFMWSVIGYVGVLSLGQLTLVPWQLANLASSTGPFGQVWTSPRRHRHAPTPFGRTLARDLTIQSGIIGLGVGVITAGLAWVVSPGGPGPLITLCTLTICVAVSTMYGWAMGISAQRTLPSAGPGAALVLALNHISVLPLMGTPLAVMAWLGRRANTSILTLDALLLGGGLLALLLTTGQALLSGHQVRRATRQRPA